MRYAASAVALVAALLWWCNDTPAPSLKVGSFNIENFPKRPRQVHQAFQTLARLELDAVALQEITDPKRAEKAAREFLGETWKAAFCRRCPEQKLGVIYNSDVLRLRGTREYHELAIYRGARPAFEARFDGLRIIAVHLKAGSDGAKVREKQLELLRPILAAAVATGDRVVLAGDFNATGDADRAAIAELAAATGATWATRDVDCTCYWQRRESCFAAALDHALVAGADARVEVGGACAADSGCRPGRSCPVYKTEVSDHCPLGVELR